MDFPDAGNDLFLFPYCCIFILPLAVFLFCHTQKSKEREWMLETGF